MKTFLCHSSNDSTFVIEFAKYLKPNLKHVFLYEKFQKSDKSFVQTINQELSSYEVFILFLGETISEFQIAEADIATKILLQGTDMKKHIFVIRMPNVETLPQEFAMLGRYPIIPVFNTSAEEAFRIAKKIIKKLEKPWLSNHRLPSNPHLFSYEKDIIKYYIEKLRLDDLKKNKKRIPRKEQSILLNIQEKTLEGCPTVWPVLGPMHQDTFPNPIPESERGNNRPEHARVVAAALSQYHQSDEKAECSSCLIREKLYFPEAGPRENLYFPRESGELNVGIIVSGGIAPGINAVIDGIVQRHRQYAVRQKYPLRIYGFKNGFAAFAGLPQSICNLAVENIRDAPLTVIKTSDHANSAGSILGTARVEKLISIATRDEKIKDIISNLRTYRIDILYIIGGDGSMKAAHAIYNVAKEMSESNKSSRELSVIAVPKTMDNDILWVWQSFGFLSAVEKAREVIENLAVEVTSNPRLCVVQLFGSDSGFVVSHAVLACGKDACDVALIPEIKFSMDHLAGHLTRIMIERQKHIPYGLVVMAETAIPLDAMRYVDETKRKTYIDVGLSDDEKEAIRNFDALRNEGKRIEGQTNDYLRNAGLKIVSRGLNMLLKRNARGGIVDWSKLRVFTNEPRHLLRSMPPSCIDFINANRLGTLSVDNALAGYTDFMISQWLTEYVLVPLDLVVLGRKRIPNSGIFWKTVLSKTGQPEKLYSD
jgi:6-phosphofructokinase 1